MTASRHSSHPQVVFNPAVIEECLADPVALTMLEELAIECVSKNHNMKLQASGRRRLADAHDRRGQAATDTTGGAPEKTAEAAPGAGGEEDDESMEALMARLAPVGGGPPAPSEGDGIGTGNAQAELSTESLIAQLSAARMDSESASVLDGGGTAPAGLGGSLHIPGLGRMDKGDEGESRGKGMSASAHSAAPSRSKPLIAPLEDAKEITPTYSLGPTADGSALVLTVDLPEVDSVAEIDVDISPRKVELHVLDAYRLVLPLNQTIDDEAAAAKFLKKRHVLKLTMPIVA
jgi:hypothetical protein